MKKNKCNIVMLATDRLSQIVKFVDEKKILVSSLPQIKGDKYHLYITSSDDVIKEGDTNFYVHYNSFNVEEAGIKLITEVISDEFTVLYTSFNEAIPVEYCKKIIATTDPEFHKDGVAKIGLPFIEKYITEYNKSTPITTVLVEYDNRCCGRCDGINDLCLTDQQCVVHKKDGCEDCFGKTGDQPKLRSDGTIIIHKIQEVFTKEDLKNAFMGGYFTNGELKPKEFETWFEQNY